MSGELTYVDHELDGVAGVDGLAGAGGVVVSPDGVDVYVAGKNDDSLAHFRRSPVTGELVFVNAYHDPTGLPSAHGVRCSPDGDLVLVSCRSDRVSIFERDPATGALTRIEVFYDNLPLNRLSDSIRFELSPDGTSAYSVGAADNALVAFRVVLFGDGFESGSIDEWSTETP